MIISHNARYTPSSVPIVEHARLPILGEGHAAQEKILMASTELKSILDRSSDSASHLTAMTGSQLVAVLQDCAEQTLSFDAAPSKSEVVRWGASESADLLDCGWALGAVIHRRLHTSYYEARERQALRMCDALCAEEDFLKERKKPVKVSAMSKKKKKQKKKRNENIACAKSGTVDSGPRVDFVAEEFPAEDEMGNAPILGQEVEMTRGPAPACVPNECGPRNSLPSDDEMFMDNDEEIATKEVSGECTAVAQQSSGTAMPLATSEAATPAAVSHRAYCESSVADKCRELDDSENIDTFSEPEEYQRRCHRVRRAAAKKSAVTQESTRAGSAPYMSALVSGSKHYEVEVPGPASLLNHLQTPAPGNSGEEGSCTNEKAGDEADNVAEEMDSVENAFIPPTGPQPYLVIGDAARPPMPYVLSCPPPPSAADSLVQHSMPPHPPPMPYYYMNRSSMPYQIPVAAPYPLMAEPVLGIPMAGPLALGVPSSLPCLSNGTMKANESKKSIERGAPSSTTCFYSMMREARFRQYGIHAKPVVRVEKEPEPGFKSFDLEGALSFLKQMATDATGKDSSRVQEICEANGSGIPHGKPQESSEGPKSGSIHADRRSFEMSSLNKSHIGDSVHGNHRRKRGQVKGQRAPHNPNSNGPGRFANSKRRGLSAGDAPGKGEWKIQAKV